MAYSLNDLIASRRHDGSWWRLIARTVPEHIARLCSACDSAFALEDHGQLCDAESALLAAIDEQYGLDCLALPDGPDSFRLVPAE